MIEQQDHLIDPRPTSRSGFSRRAGLLSALTAGEALLLASCTPPTPAASRRRVGRPVATATPAPQESRVLVYSEDFSTWDTGKDDCVENIYDKQQGTFTKIAMCAPRRNATFANQLFLDFDLELEAQKLRGGELPSYGVVLGVNRRESPEIHHLFSVSGVGNYGYHVSTLERQPAETGGTYTQTGLRAVQDFPVAPEIKKGNSTNLFSVVRRGSVVDFSVNGGTVYKAAIDLSKDKAVALGVFIATQTSPASAHEIGVQFSKFRVYQPQVRATPSPTRVTTP